MYIMIIYFRIVLLRKCSYESIDKMKMDINIKYAFVYQMDNKAWLLDYLVLKQYQMHKICVLITLIMNFVCNMDLMKSIEQFQQRIGYFYHYQPYK